MEQSVVGNEGGVVAHVGHQLVDEGCVERRVVAAEQVEMETYRYVPVVRASSHPMLDGEDEGFESERPVMDHDAPHHVYYVVYHLVHVVSLVR